MRRVKLKYYILGLIISGTGLLAWNYYGYTRAIDTSDWVLETLADHTSNPVNDSDFDWVTARRKELSSWNPTHDINIQLAKSRIDIAMLSIYYERLPESAVQSIRRDGLVFSEVQDPTVSANGRLIEKLSQYKRREIHLNSKDLDVMIATVCNQIQCGSNNLRL